jgi:hypothetical protein
MKKTSPDLTELWSMIEGLAWCLNDRGWWWQTDDPELVLATLRMIGGAVFTMVSIFMLMAP